MPPQKPVPTSYESLHASVDKWWQLLHRCILTQLVCSLLLQMSYVAFPAYNFALALWALVCCTPKWFASNPRLTVLVLGALVVSLVTDAVWMSLWISGRVFYDQFCGKNGVSLVSCGGASDYFPGCTANRFALVAMLLNDAAKVVAVTSVYRIHTLEVQVKQGGAAAASVAPQTAAAAGISSIRAEEIHPLQATTSTAP
jgi:hypothetical protein